MEKNYLVFNKPFAANYPGHIFREIYEDKIYAPFVNGKKDLTILDIGGNLGWTAYYFSEFASKVIVLEPHKPHFEIIREMIMINSPHLAKYKAHLLSKLKDAINVESIEVDSLERDTIIEAAEAYGYITPDAFEAWKLDNGLEDIIIPINKAIDVQNDPKPFYHNANTTMHSLNPAVEDGSQENETVECITLDRLFEEQGLDHVDIMKIDIEGTESELLANENFLKIAPKVDLVMGESHAWDPRNRNQLSEALKVAGYQVSTMPSAADIFVGHRIK